VTILATICADGSSLPPALIYKAVSGDLQDTWLQDHDPLEKPCWFASSSNGWTSNELGLSWLKSLFDTQTFDKARRVWRLLILHGHGSHCTIKFLDWCRSNRILVAIFPPHATHRLQPLDVSLFRPLATYYSQQLDHHTRLSQGIASLTKRDFLNNFNVAYDKAFTEANIMSGWRKTGIEPFNPEQVLKIFKKEEPDDEGVLTAQTPPSTHSSSCLDSPSAIRTIRRIVNEEAAHRDAQSQKLVDKLGGACLSFATELILAKEREKGLIETINNQKNKRKRGRSFTEELRAQEGLGVLFFSPSKVARAKELQLAKDEAKELETHHKQLRAQDRAAKKAQKQAEAQHKRNGRTARAAARKTEEALKKAQMQRQTEAKKTRKQLETESKTSDRRPRKKQKTQKEAQKPMVIMIEPEPQIDSDRLRSRSGRTIKKPAHFDEI